MNAIKSIALALTLSLTPVAFTAASAANIVETADKAGSFGTLLAAILALHVLPRELASNMLPGRAIHVKTLNTGNMLAVTKSSRGVTVAASNSANVVSGDIKADNGIIHVIDTVLLP